MSHFKNKSYHVLNSVVASVEDCGVPDGIPLVGKLVLDCGALVDVSPVGIIGPPGVVSLGNEALDETGGTEVPGPNKYWLYKLMIARIIKIIIS